MDESSKQQIAALSTTIANLQAQYNARIGPTGSGYDAAAQELDDKLQRAVYERLVFHSDLNVETQDQLDAVQDRLAVVERTLLGDPSNQQFQTEYNQLWTQFNRLRQDMQWLQENSPF